MKKSFKTLLFPLLLLCFMAIAQIGLAQLPAPPPPPGEKGQAGNKAPMSSPIDGGLTVILAFAAGYTGREWAKGKKRIDN